MKLNRTAATAISFGLGAVLFVSTAFADVALGSGYDRLKGSMKSTAKQMDKELKSYTLDVFVTAKDNGDVMLQNTSTIKSDNEKKASEHINGTKYNSGKSTSNYNYRDQECSIWKNQDDSKYIVTTLAKSKKQEFRSAFSNPFDEEHFDEIEKVIDAMVGSLKDNVHMEDTSDGGRQYIGNLSQEQVPAVVNAITSFFVKQNIIRDGQRMDDEVVLPMIKDDLYIKSISGKASETKSGLLETLLGEVLLSGKDKDGTQHDLSFEVLMKLSDVNQTKVEKPDLKGKDVETNTEAANGFDKKYVGKYISNVIIEKDGAFVKIGERILNIEKIDDGKVFASYKEEFKPGYEEYSVNHYAFQFTCEPDSEDSSFEYTNASGEKELGQMFRGGNGKIYLNLGMEKTGKNSYRMKAARDKYFDGDFTRVFE